MRARTLGLYLIGNRQAILDLAVDRQCLWIGLLFVLSAGFAREYDGQDLLREPWHLLIPVGASLAASFLLFLVACGWLFLGRAWKFLPMEGGAPFFTAYRSFLTLFWMTAPLAWLYAVPYERFLSPGAATNANLWTLALVAAWRVALMVRVVSVITGRGIDSLFLVMAFGDAVALTAIYLMPKPVVSLMGGVRLTESEAAIQGATFLVSCLGILSAPVWGIGGLVAFFSGQPAWAVPTEPRETVSASRGLWILAALSLAIWLPMLPWTQAEQRLRTRAEEDFYAGRIADALDLMSAHAQADFPPHWEPPPRIGYGEMNPAILDIMQELLARDVPPWVRKTFVDKLRRYLEDRYSFHFIPRGKVTALVRVLSRLPEGPDMVSEHKDALETLLSRPDIPKDTCEDLRALLEAAELKSR